MFYIPFIHSLFRSILGYKPISFRRTKNQLCKEYYYAITNLMPKEIHYPTITSQYHRVSHFYILWQEPFLTA